MPRDPISALIQFPAGMLLEGVGFVMSAWAATAYLKVELGFDAMMWALKQAPIEWGLDPLRLANRAIQDDALVAIGVTGLVLWIVGLSLLRAARANMRPAGSAVDEAHAQAIASYGMPHALVAVPARAAAAAPAGSTVFARTLLGDPRAPNAALPHSAQETVALRPALEEQLAGWARLIGTNGKFTAQQRAALAKLTPEQHAVLAKFSKWAPTRKQAIIGALAVYVAVFEILPSLFSHLMRS